MKESDIRNQEVLNKYLDMVQADVKKLFNPLEFQDVPCPACGSDEYQIEFNKNGFTYVECKECGTLFVNPRPTQKQLDMFYSKSESNKFWAEEFFMPYAEARREKIFKPRAKEIADQFSEYSMGRIGDIGGGLGLFIEELKKEWPEAEVISIEPSVDMARMCREKGIVVIPKMIEDLDESDGKFDLLCSFELFEHLHEPGVFLEKVYSALNPGGHLLLTTLNGKGFDIQLLWEKHKNVNPPHHLNFINPYSLRRCLEKSGFQDIKITTPGKLDWDIVEGMIREGKADLGRWWNGLCDADETAKDEFQKWITKNGFSSHIRVVAQKPKK